MTAIRRISPLLALGTVALLLSACASSFSSAALVTASPELPTGPVIAQGTVLDDGDSVELCLGPVAESYPPQCDGIPLTGWTWEGTDGSESASGVTWGAYAVTGTYDGDSFTVTGAPLLLALYDPIRPEDPTGGNPGTTSDAELGDIQEQLTPAMADDLLDAYIDNGYLWVTVVWDDGSWQAAVDEEYGSAVVIVQSALQAVTP